MKNSTALILSAPASGSGKTTLTLGILRALRSMGIGVRSAKSGPDYIDPRFHAAASGAECVNLDAWAMGAGRIRALAQPAAEGPLVIEGAMGLFDGAPPKGRGATADLARILGVPVVLILDCAKQAHSVAALATGFANFRADINVAGVILNNVGSPRHEMMLRTALGPTGLRVLGAVYRQAALSLPARHLGLVQAQEHPDLDVFLDQAAEIMRQSIDLDALLDIATPLPDVGQQPSIIAPPAQRIAVARDAAFAFAYPHLLAGWRHAGAEISQFSPLADQAPRDCDLVFLPGGYPELHAGRLAANETFLNGLRSAPAVYGECGGYMVLGDGLIDKDGARHKMAGLLRLETSFAARKLHLGYRRLSSTPGVWNEQVNAHEFHYASTLKAEGKPLFSAKNAENEDLAPMGLINGSVSGSFAHIIDRAN